MNAAEFASRLLDLVASAVPDDVPISKRLEAEIDTLIDEFTAPPEPVLKFDEDRRMVYGWASVISKNGQTIIDRQGDVVTADDLREAVHDFMKHRTAGEMHDQMGVGEVVESFVLDAAVQKSLGIDLGMEGWYVGVHVPNDEVWAKVKKGDYKAFSIGGSAVREPISDEDSKDFLLAKGYKAINDGSPSEDGACPACGKKHAKGKCVKKGGYGKMCKDCGKKCGPDGKCGCMKKFNPNHGPDGRFSSGGGMRGAGRGSRSAGAKLTGGEKPGKGDPKRLGGSRVTGVRRDSDGRKMYDTKDLEGIPAGQTKKKPSGGAAAAAPTRRTYPKFVNTAGARKQYDMLHDNPGSYVELDRKTGKFTFVNGTKRTPVLGTKALSTMVAVTSKGKVTYRPSKAKEASPRAPKEFAVGTTGAAGQAAGKKYANSELKAAYAHHKREAARLIRETPYSPKENAVNFHMGAEYVLRNRLLMRKK